MEIRIAILEVPPGNSPKHVRRAWVGLVLPLATGETGPRRNAGTTVFGRCLRKLFGMPRWYYVVPADAALTMLERAAPEAAAWWRTNAPDQIGPGKTFEFPAEVCEKQIRLAVGTRTVLVGTRPVSSILSAGFRSTRLRRVSADRLVLKPTGIRLFGLALLLGGLVFILGFGHPELFGFQARKPDLGVIFMDQIGLFLLVIGLYSLVLPRTYEFDRAAGVLRISWQDSQRVRSLRTIAAVQLLVHRVGGKHRHYCYQMNLVLLDDPPWRLCLSDNRYGEATRAAAAQLSDFLGVPLLDEVSGTYSGGTDSGAESNQTPRSI
jgi:hypothetical protein